MYSLIWSWQCGWSSINRSITNTSYKFNLAASELTAQDINLYDDRIQFNHRPRAANSFWTPSREPTDWSLAHIAVIVMFLLSINVNNSEYISMILPSVGISFKASPYPTAKINLVLRPSQASIQYLKSSLSPIQLIVALNMLEGLSPPPSRTPPWRLILPTQFASLKRPSHTDTSTTT